MEFGLYRVTIYKLISEALKTTNHPVNKQWHTNSILIPADDQIADIILSARAKNI